MKSWVQLGLKWTWWQMWWDLAPFFFHQSHRCHPRLVCGSVFLTFYLHPQGCTLCYFFTLLPLLASSLKCNRAKNPSVASAARPHCHYRESEGWAQVSTGKWQKLFEVRNSVDVLELAGCTAAAPKLHSVPSHFPISHRKERSGVLPPKFTCLKQTNLI